MFEEDVIPETGIQIYYSLKNSIRIRTAIETYVLRISSEIIPTTHSMTYIGVKTILAHVFDHYRKAIERIAPGTIPEKIDAKALLELMNRDPSRRTSSTAKPSIEVGRLTHQPARSAFSLE